MRKLMYLLYTFMAAALVGAVFLIGCDGGTSGGGDNNTQRTNCSWSAVGSQSYCQELIDDNDCRSGGTYYISSRVCTGSNCSSCYY